MGSRKVIGQVRKLREFLRGPLPEAMQRAEGGGIILYQPRVRAGGMQLIGPECSTYEEARAHLTAMRARLLADEASRG